VPAVKRHPALEKSSRKRNPGVFQRKRSVFGRKKSGWQTKKSGRGTKKSSGRTFFSPRREKGLAEGLFSVCSGQRSPMERERGLGKAGFPMKRSGEVLGGNLCGGGREKDPASAAAVAGIGLRRGGSSGLLAESGSRLCPLPTNSQKLFCTL
jgi:hypothetical protein